MICQWEPLIQILPIWMRQDVDRLGKKSMEELRLRLGFAPKLIFADRTCTLSRVVSQDDLKFCVNAVSRYSPWASATSAQGYITCIGGHRVGLCGETVMQGNVVSGISSFSSLCIRVSRDFPGIASALTDLKGNVLIIGRPGSGKTTLMRDYIRIRSQFEQVCVIDERRELFPKAGESMCYLTGDNTDVLIGTNKICGIEMVLRAMGPQVIAVDEITSAQDCRCMLKAGWCGVALLATAHASSKDELLKRPLYRPLVSSELFKWLVILQQDKSFRVERM